ncbi:MAG: hypothetical protein QOD89_3085 [Bradyrhizobium sp.]|jgi:hypothetical protein|nr:hypothetical protein [Bradyrhizobium sp.]
MRRRLISGALGASLLVALLPGAVSADPTFFKEGPAFLVFGSCTTSQGQYIAVGSRGPAGWAQSFVMKYLADQGCSGPSIYFTITKL